MAELVLTLNTFEFNGEYYEEVGGVAMGSRWGPNNACLFFGYVEERMLTEYPGLDAWFVYSSDTWTTSRVQSEALNRTYSSFLIVVRSTVLILSIRGLSHLTNSPSWKFIWHPVTTAYRHLFITKTLTAIHIWTSGRHIHPSVKSSTQYSRFLRLRKICSEDDVFFKMRPQPWRVFCGTWLPPWANYKSTSPGGRKTEGLSIRHHPG